MTFEASTRPEGAAGPGGQQPLRVLIAGGGVAGAEALLALRELAGDRVQLTLLSPSDELVLPALSVAEPFALGHAQHVALQAVIDRTGAELVSGSLAAVDDTQHRVSLEAGGELAYDALLIAVGARPVARIDHATTWWPHGDTEAFSGLLRDLEEGYTKRVAFIIPPGAVWPLPLYELALMTAREVQSMGIADAELTVVTPEAAPLSVFGQGASVAVRDELSAAGIGLETASVPRVERGETLAIVLQPSSRRLVVDRVIALPAVKGPAIPGTSQNDAGFIRAGYDGQMEGSSSVWAAGDAIAYPVKYGGISTQQADAAAHAIAVRAGVKVPEVPRLALRGMLMTGAEPRPLGRGEATRPSHAAPMWLPTGKVFGVYLTPFLESLEDVEVESADEPPAGAGVVVDQPLEQREAELDALLGSEEHLRRLGHEISSYERQHPIETS